MSADIGGGNQGPEDAVKAVQQNGSANGPALELVRSCIEGHSQRLLQAVEQMVQILRRFRRRRLKAPEQQTLRLQDTLFLRRAYIEALLIDQVLHHRVDQHGNIQLLIDGLADTGGTDRLVKRRQGQELHLAPENGGKLLRTAAAVAAENYVIVGGGTAGACLPVG